MSSRIILNYEPEKELIAVFGVFMSLADAFYSIIADFSDIIEGRGEINADVFVNPSKYIIFLPIEKVVADRKVSRQGVELYKQKIASNQKIGPIIVVKHPRKDLYAVLDGHHRYYALMELGKTEIKCALAGDYSAVIFYLTQHGYFQPIPEITENIRQPALRLNQNLKQFLNHFLNAKNEESQQA